MAWPRAKNLTGSIFNFFPQPKNQFETQIILNQAVRTPQDISLFVMKTLIYYLLIFGGVEGLGGVKLVRLKFKFLVLNMVITSRFSGFGV